MSELKKLQKSMEELQEGLAMHRKTSKETEDLFLELIWLLRNKIVNEKEKQNGAS